jgi:LacI family transcriptional regulator
MCRKMKKPITINDIASHFNVSNTAVSFILNGKARKKKISTTLETRVLNYVNQVGYYPNRYAQAMHSGKSGVIALIIRDISDSYCNRIAKGLEKLSAEFGLTVLIGSSGDSLTKMNSLLRSYGDSQVDAIILEPLAGTENAVGELAKSGLPLILLRSSAFDLDLPSVSIDLYSSTYEVTKKFAAYGYQHMALISSGANADLAFEKERGYTDAQNELGRDPVIKKIRNSIGERVFEIGDFLKKNVHTDLLLFTDGPLCYAGLTAIKNMGITVPSDLGIVVFEDSDVFRLLTPSISAMVRPIDQIVNALFKVTITLLNSSEDISPRHIILKPELTIRESSRLDQAIFY